jgi:hypothetical protein
MDKVKKTAFTDYSAPSSEPFRLHKSIILTELIALQIHCMQHFGRNNRKERDHLGDLGVDWRTILKWIVVIESGVEDWIPKVQVSDRL